MAENWVEQVKESFGVIFDHLMLGGYYYLKIDQAHSVPQNVDNFPKYSQTVRKIIITSKDWRERMVNAATSYYLNFPNTIPRERQDANLLYQLISEKDSIVSKAINAYWELKKRSYHFSGDYLLNSGSFLLDSAESGRNDMKPLIQDFLLKNYETAPYDEVVFMSDAYAMFEQMVGPVYLNQFGLHFGNMAIGILRAVKDKVRKKGETNATSCLRGMRLKNHNNCKGENSNGKKEVFKILMALSTVF